MFTSILAVIGWQGIIIGIVAIWLVFALIKRLLKVAVLAAVILALVYFFYPMAETVLKFR